LEIKHSNKTRNPPKKEKEVELKKSDKSPTKSPSVPRVSYLGAYLDSLGTFREL